MELHIEAKVRFIGTVVFHGIIPGHALNGAVNVIVNRFFENIADHLFRQLQYIFLIHEGHFHIELCEFGLPVRP